MRRAPFSLALSEPLGTAKGPIEDREGDVIRYDHRGATGLGEAAPLPGWTESLSHCRGALDRAAEAAPEGHSSVLLTFDAAETPAARSGFSTALIDADARADGLPMYRWFDADRRCRSVPVNATLGDADPAATAAAAREAVAAGFDCLKLKIGARTLDADRERVAAVRETVGEEVTLRVDANGAYDRGEAATAVETFAALGVEYVEQPLPAEDLAGHADLRGRGTGIALDEAMLAYDAATVLDSDAADVLVLKPAILGGPGNAHVVGLRAGERGIDPVVSTTIDAVVARTAAVHVAAALPDVRPCGLATADRLAEDLAPDPAPVADGEITVPQDDGLGIDPDAVRPGTDPTGDARPENDPDPDGDAEAGP